MSLFAKRVETVRRLDYVKAHSQYLYFRESAPTAVPLVNMAGKRLMMLGATCLGFMPPRPKTNPNG